MNKTDKRIRIQLIIPEPMLAQIDELAEGEGSPRAAVIRGCVKEHLDRMRLGAREIERQAA